MNIEYYYISTKSNRHTEYKIFLVVLWQFIKRNIRYKFKEHISISGSNTRINFALSSPINLAILVHSPNSIATRNSKYYKIAIFTLIKLISLYQIIVLSCKTSFDTVRLITITI